MPISLQISRWRTQPVIVKTGRKLYLPAVQRWGAEQRRTDFAYERGHDGGRVIAAPLDAPIPRRRPMESRSDPTVVYLDPDGKYELKPCALARDAKVKLNELITFVAGPRIFDPGL